jgi:hypothetical protein
VRIDAIASCGSRECGDEQLDRLADLDAEAISDLFLVVQALAQQRRKLPLRRHGQETPALKQRNERTHHVSF